MQIYAIFHKRKENACIFSKSKVLIFKYFKILSDGGSHGPGGYFKYTMM